MAEAQNKSTQAAAAEADATAGQPSYLDLALGETEKQGLTRDRAKDLMQAVIAEATKGTLTWDKNVTRSIQKGIDAIDEALSKQLAAIMHNPAFQKLEGTWRGLRHLVFESETSTSLKIKVINLPKRDLFKDLDTAVEFDQSQMFKKLYEDEFGMPGGAPFGAVIGDYEFTNHPEDVDLLQKMSGVAAAGFCPFISAASPELFGLKDFTDLSRPRDLAKIFDSNEYTKWRSFRETEDSRYTTLVLPRVLSRLPYGASTKPVDEFNFEEVELDSTGKAKPVPHDNYAWMNAAYVYGTVLTRAFAQTQWCTAIRGKENGGTVAGLPVHLFTSDSGDTKVKCPTEIAITDRRDAELSKLGFLPLCHYKSTDYSVFFGGQTVQKPKQFVSPKDTANSEISARLPYIMASSRIAHYLKMIARDRIGSFMEASDCQDWLTRWISQYVLADDHPSEEMKRRFPLKEAKIEVREIPGKPGAYAATALLRPWLQMEELNAALSMVAEIPKG
jgi:type VI secretion system protein ImpC